MIGIGPSLASQPGRDFERRAVPFYVGEAFPPLRVLKGWWVAVHSGAVERTEPMLLLRPTETFGKGRVCADHRCGTVLSVYNPDRYCSLCMKYHRRRLVAEEAAAYIREYQRGHRERERVG